jgi:hypothetical protein
MVSYIWVSEKFNTIVTVSMSKNLRTIERSLNVFNLHMLHISFIQCVVWILKSNNRVKLMVLSLTLRRAVSIISV